MKISVVAPSRLQVNPTSNEGRLWLDRALMSVKRQSVYADHEWEFLVGIDANAPWPPERFSDVRFIRSTSAGQALAVNAAAAHATGDVLAFIEDDDLWYPHKMAAQLRVLLGTPGWREMLLPVKPPPTYDLVTCNSREIDEYGNFIAVNDFAGPSSWLMTRETWTKVGPFDESFKWHVDTEWLGRANAAGVKRVHLINEGNRDERGWLEHIGKHSAIVVTDGEQEPLVARLRNPQGGMSTIARDRAEGERSRVEHARMRSAFGEVPW